MSYTALQSDGIELGPSWRLAAARRIAAFAVFHHLGGALQHAYFADAGYIAAVPFDPKLEILVGIKALRIDCKLRHESRSLSLDLSCHLLDLKNDKLRRLEWCKTHHDVDDSQIDVVLGCGFLVALDEVGIGRRLALESAETEKVLHECAHVQANLCPQRLVIR